MTAQLPDGVYEEVRALCKQGDEEAKTGSRQAARQNYMAALQLLPGDPRVWDAATWIYVSIGETYFGEKDFENAFKCYFNAVQSAGGLGNTLVHLRLGQLYYEGGKLEKAGDELARAYMGAGADIFIREDPKYFEFLKTKIII